MQNLPVPYLGRQPPDREQSVSIVDELPGLRCFVRAAWVDMDSSAAQMITASSRSGDDRVNSASAHPLGHSLTRDWW